MNPDPYVPPCHVQDRTLRHELIGAQIKRAKVTRGGGLASWDTLLTKVQRVRGYGYGTETVSAGDELHLLVPSYAVTVGVDSEFYVLAFHPEGQKWMHIPHQDVWRIEPYVEPAAIDQAITKITSSSE